MRKFFGFKPKRHPAALKPVAAPQVAAPPPPPPPPPPVAAPPVAAPPVAAPPSDIEEAIKQLEIKRKDYGQEISESTQLFLSAVGTCAGIFPIVGPIIVLGANILLLPFQHSDLKMQIEGFVYQIIEYTNSITRVTDQLLKEDLKKINHTN